MSEVHPGGCAGVAMRSESGHVALRAAEWLGLAAAPTFAIMALVAVIQGDGIQGMVCAAARNASPLTGMATMYLLMGAFHLAPWLRLITNWRSGARLC